MVAHQQGAFAAKPAEATLKADVHALADENTRLRKETEAQKRTIDEISRGIATRGRRMVVEATAYNATADQCGDDLGITASGTHVKEGRTIAVDPRVIPLGSKVFIPGRGVYVAEDTGRVIKGAIIDIYLDSVAEAERFGRQQLIIYVAPAH
jgi:3D (Asp-Asp-Asp) domain-containing protein